jgi:chromosome segregation ATPase
MITGRDTLEEINSHVLQAQSGIEAADRELNSLNTQLNRLRLQTAEQYRELAKFRLDEQHAGSVTDRLEKAHQAVPAFLDQRREALAALEKSIGQVQQRQQALEKKRESLRDARDSAAEALQQQIARSKTALEQTDAYHQARKQAAIAVQVAKRADEKASQSEADLSDKGQPYRDDALFMYLWQRRYLTPDYRHGGIIRMLDGWVAGLIGYRQARADFHMLNELPLRMREHATTTAEEAKKQQQALLAMEREAAEKDGVPALQSALDEAEKKLQQVNDDIEAAEKRYQELLEQKNAFAAGEDEYTQKAVGLLAAELEGEDIIALMQQAKATPRPEDDAIVMRLHQLQKEQKSVSDRIAELKNEQQQQRKALEELAKLRGKFRRSNYDARRSTFPSNLGLGILLGEILGGGRSSGSAWDRIDHSQKWDFPDFGGGGGGGFGGSDGGGFGGFGGFGSGGGFGGGGFTSGGGF